VRRRFGQRALFFLKREHSLFYRFLGYQAVHEHGPLLADAVRAISRMVSDGWSPPRSEQEHAVCRRQVQAGSASLERDQHDARLHFVLELRHHPATIARGAVQSRELDPRRLQQRLHAIEQARPLREHERLVIFGEHFVEQDEQELELRGRVRGLPRQEAGMARGLAQP